MSVRSQHYHSSTWIPPTVVPYTLHYAMQGHGVTRLVRRPALSHLISPFISKPRKSWGQALNWPVWLFVLVASICWCPWWVQSDISCQEVDIKRFGSLYMPRIQWYKWYQDMYTTVHCELISWHSRLSIHSFQILWYPRWDWSCTALQALWGCPAWGTLYSWCCGGPSRGFSGSTYERHAW